MCFRSMVRLLDASDTLDDKRFGGDRPSLVEAAHIHATRKRNAKRLCAEDRCTEHRLSTA